MVRLFHVLTIIGCMIGGVTFAGAFVSSVSAPQQAALAAMAVAWAAIPYCLARAATELWETPAEKQLVKLNKTLEAHTKLLASLANDSAGRLEQGKRAPEPTGQF